VVTTQDIVRQPGDLVRDARPASLAGRRVSRLSDRLVPWVLLTPWLIGLVAITLGPMLASLYLSFTDYTLLGQPNWVGLDNYVRMLTDDPKFFAAASVTLHYVLVSVPLQLAFALALAVLLNRGLAGQELFTPDGNIGFTADTFGSWLDFWDKLRKDQVIPPRTYRRRPMRVGWRRIRSSPIRLRSSWRARMV